MGARHLCRYSDIELSGKWVTYYFVGYAAESLPQEDEPIVEIAAPKGYEDDA
jgi:hypothetical protein